MADNWNPKLLQVITVAVDPVDGTLYLVDGGHRVTAARLLGITSLTADVKYGLSKEERAELFIELQSERKPINPLTLFNVRITAGHVRETEIERLLFDRGMKVGGSPSTNVVASISGLTKTYDDGGKELVGKTIDVLRAAFGTHGGDAWQPDILRGTAIVLFRNATIDIQRLVRTLQTDAPRMWLSYVATRSRGSGGSGGRPMHMAKLIVERYNSGLTAKSKKRIAL